MGSIIIPGSTEAWNLNLNFILQSDDYEELISSMDSLESTIVMHTNYVLKIDRTSSSTKDYKILAMNSNIIIMKTEIISEFDGGVYCFLLYKGTP